MTKNLIANAPSLETVRAALQGSLPFKGHCQMFDWARLEIADDSDPSPFAVIKYVSIPIRRHSYAPFGLIASQLDSLQQIMFALCGNEGEFEDIEHEGRSWMFGDGDDGGAAWLYNPGKDDFRLTFWLRTFSTDADDVEA